MTSGVSAGRTWAAKAMAETPKGAVCWEKKIAPSRFRCGQSIAWPQLDIHRLQRVDDD